MKVRLPYAPTKTPTIISANFVPTLVAVAKKAAAAGKKDAEKPAAAKEVKAAAKKAADAPIMSDDERRKLVSTEQSLGMEAEPK